MKSTIFICILFCVPFFVSAQNDTLYVYIDEGKGWEIGTPMGKHKKDPELQNGYPFDGGRAYSFKKKLPSVEDVRFYYHSYTPVWVDIQFIYKIVDISILEKKDFKNAEWFDKTNYHNIMETFYGRDKVIYLIDEKQILDSTKIFMVRVFLSYSANE